jgi:hypothetical protein
MRETKVAQAMRPSLSDEIDRTRLRHAHIDRKVGAAPERHDVIDGEAPAPVLLGQTIDADPPAKAAAGVANPAKRPRVALLF